ncbi:hypothetical protein WN51_07143 [Melipona quadrifasciata]|uniref:Uncharacterized protein n=1 Tax=Melipona quadrifasciata TaxID=166423 RepID=A0A0N0BJM6_9HYME|nr:hypothetical protein WN51_07143 [Melipona quadrifasciata]
MPKVGKTRIIDQIVHVNAMHHPKVANELITRSDESPKLLRKNRVCEIFAEYVGSYETRATDTRAKQEDENADHWPDNTRVINQNRSDRTNSVKFLFKLIVTEANELKRMNNESKKFGSQWRDKTEAKHNKEEKYHSVGQTDQ